MEHFARWVFMRARQLGMLGESELAERLMTLAREASSRARLSMRAIDLLAHTIGWKATGHISHWRERMRG
jgi:hypothetical protein